MTAGIPGIGIGGLFYLLCALLMPLVELVRRAGGHGPSRPWPAVLLQAGLAWGTLGAIWATGWVVGAVLAAVPTGGDDLAVAAEAAEAAAQAGTVYGIPSAAAGLVTLAVLALVLLAVQALRLTRGRRPRPAGVHVVRTAPAARSRTGSPRTG